MTIVSLTTTSKRLPFCRVALISLLTQSVLPKKIHLWVSDSPYLRDEGIHAPKVLEDFLVTIPRLSSVQIDVRWTKNTGPYRKLIPSLREASQEDIIVTADDDIFYGENWLKKLLETYDPSVNIAVAARVRKKKYNFLGRKTSYLYWDILHEPSILSDDYMVTFGGGAVLSKSLFREQDIADDAFLKVAPTADDLWYSKLLRRNNTKVRVVPDVLHELNFIEHQDGLINHNFPKPLSFVDRVRRRLWDYTAGYFGGAVCGNDRAYQRIETYFQKADSRRSVLPRKVG